MVNVMIVPWRLLDTKVVFYEDQLHAWWHAGYPLEPWCNKHSSSSCHCHCCCHEEIYSTWLIVESSFPFSFNILCLFRDTSYSKAWYWVYRRYWVCHGSSQSCVPVFLFFWVSLWGRRMFWTRSLEMDWDWCFGRFGCFGRIGYQWVPLCHYCRCQWQWQWSFPALSNRHWMVQ